MSGSNGRRWLPAYQWYPADFASDETVREMDFVERAIYREMLDIQWLSGSCPASRGRLARIIGCSEEQLENAMNGPLGEKWVARDGRLYNPRMEREREEAEEFLKRKAEAGKKGAQARWGGKRMAGASEGRKGANATAMRIDGPHPTPPHPTPPQSSPTEKNARARKTAPVTDDEFEAMLGMSALGAPARQALRDWREYKRAQYGQTYVGQTWSRSIAKAERDQERFTACVELHIEKGWKNLEESRLDEHRSKGQGPEPSLTPRANLQRKNADVLRRFAESEDAPRIMEIEEGRDD